MKRSIDSNRFFAERKISNVFCPSVLSAGALEVIRRRTNKSPTASSDDRKNEVINIQSPPPPT